ncbi:sugar transferase [Pseudomonas sp. ANT_H14]|uniref:sugar transferase n=1 Tax=unclassified Pseudomonas TaxID=196821 RepID=UPI0011EEEEC6|nr:MULTISPECIES: sugar transferase [unclassified Pseudomonas]KAA0947517.1 sugar transferase [Pseudomonas sp. ANT_H4]KAA0953935.1 sugar transferase [Pseudomonas sp. ANT_H14]
MLKRFFDLFLSIFGLLVLAPFFMCLAFWIKLDSPGPVFFRQVRLGRYGIPFRIHKFRTMNINSEQEGRLTIGSDGRITRSGHFLRKYKLDELPQLIDVFLGRMSLVGPRPEVQEFIDMYSKEIRERVLSVRPGITDRASIEMIDENQLLAGYSDPRKAYIDIILPVKQKYYLAYIDEQGFLIDLKIILATFSKLLRR